MPALKQLGFASIINFRTAGEDGANIEASRMAATQAGLKYIHIPFRAPNPEVTEEFLEALNTGIRYIPGENTLLNESIPLNLLEVC